MSEVRTQFLESSADPKLESLPLAHVSVELGHMYLEDLLGGITAIRDTFAAIAPWARAAEDPAAIGCAKPTIRASTCFLIDDYSGHVSSPEEVIPMILSAAESEGLRIDYLARESACVQAGDSRPADLVFGRLVTEPVSGTTGGRPPLTETGWLTNGQRSPSSDHAEAMAKRLPWEPPRESARRRHSIFVDVELFDEDEGIRIWSCPMLAAVWQLIRLGLLRENGRPVVKPQNWTGEWPGSWEELPAITRLNPDAAAFAAYTTLSVLSPRFLPVELAVRTIISQFAGDSQVLADASARAARDGMALPSEFAERIRYVFVAPGRTDPA
ncbi:MAG TPA: SCO2522 family protein [Streptosporangiaceae bacterium]|nr:SCO2522 family protein [Streptosporangiaceae bacterium]